MFSSVNTLLGKFCQHSRFFHKLVSKDHQPAPARRTCLHLCMESMGLDSQNRHQLFSFSGVGVWPAPDALRIFIDFAHTMERYAVDLAFRTHQLQSGPALLRKRQLLQRDHDNAVFRSIVIAHFEGPFGEFGIPPNTVEQFVNGDHVEGGLPASVLLLIPIFGSRTQVLWHSGHLEGFVSFSDENAKPQARQRAGSTIALYSVCFRLRNKCSKSSTIWLGDSLTSRAI